MSEDFFVTHAKAHGPIAPGTFRVVVLEHDDRITIRDFASFDDARAYAYDCASETDHDNAPIAVVIDSKFVRVEKGGHYAGL